MRSACTLLATAAASAVLVLGAPGAYAADDAGSSSYGKEHGKEWKKEHGKEWSKEKWHDSPRGGVHTGGGALSSVTLPTDDGREKPESWTEEKKAEHKKHWGKEKWHDSPRGGVHAGGGALSSVTLPTDDGREKPESWTEEKKAERPWSKGDESSESSWGGGHEKPRGGVHTGGGALAAPTVTAGGLAVLAVAGTGLYAVRRRKTAGIIA